jgi:hypothetical protein
VLQATQQITHCSTAEGFFTYQLVDNLVPTSQVFQGTKTMGKTWSVIVRVVIDDGGAVGLVEACCQMSFGESDTNSIADTLAKRTCRPRNL